MFFKDIHNQNTAKRVEAMIANQIEPKANPERQSNKSNKLNKSNEIIFFQGTPDPEKLSANSVGVNEVLLNKYIGVAPIRQKYWPGMLAYLVKNPQPDGTAPTNPEISQAVGVSPDTVLRAKKLWVEKGIIYRVNHNGAFAYNPKLLIMKDENGDIIKLPHLKKSM